jgi:hypothetical protein
MNLSRKVRNFHPFFSSRERKNNVLSTALFRSFYLENTRKLVAESDDSLMHTCQINRKFVLFN